MTSIQLGAVRGRARRKRVEVETETGSQAKRGLKESQASRGGRASKERLLAKMNQG